MPDFDLHVYANPNGGNAVMDWYDPPPEDTPANRAYWEALGNPAKTFPSRPRLNPLVGHPEKRYAVTVNVECEIRAVVGGVEAPLDSALDGRLFFPGNVEYPQAPPLHFSNSAGQTSVQRFTPRHVGHYLIYIRRPGGGQVMVHFDAVEAP
jgi:hypothetical protein